MTNAKLPVADVYLLAGIADILLWAGYDRAADVIYANLEAEGLLPSATAPAGSGGTCLALSDAWLANRLTKPPMILCHIPEASS